MKVAVLDTTKKTLAPTTPRRAGNLLKSGKAAVFRRVPFTIILKREVSEVQTPDFQFKIDPGSRTTGIAIVNQQTGEVVFAAEIIHRANSIKKSLDARRVQRRSRRNRKTRYRKPRFLNRTRPKGWLPPSLSSRVENIYTWARRLGRVYPKKLEVEGIRPLRIKATGHGSRQMRLSDKYGFPRTAAKADRVVKGFRTGDIVKAVVPKGKKQGVHVGKVAIRSSGNFNITTRQGTIQGISYRHCRLLDRANGYSING